MKHALIILLASAAVACGQVQYVFTNFAGMPGGPGNVDGTGSAARFRYPYAMALDSAGNVYVTDTVNATSRKVTPAGTVTTLAGSAGQFGSKDGSGSAAQCPWHRRSKRASRYGSDDGNGNAAQFRGPAGVAVDSAGNLYAGDAFNHTIRKITPAGAVTTLAGTAGQIGSAAQFSYPVGVAVDSAGNLYVADANWITKGTLVSPLQFVAAAGSPTVSNGMFRVQLTGPSGNSVIVESSSDLQAWTPVQTNSFSFGGLELALPLAPNQNQFFRARLAP